MYDQTEFYSVDYNDLPTVFQPYYLKCFKLDSAPDTNTYTLVMNGLERGTFHHIYECINMFFMFNEQYDVIQHRYLRRDGAGNLIETPHEMCDRIATFVASAEMGDWRSDALKKTNKWYATFLEHLLSMRMAPNTPCYAAAGIPGFGSFACSVVYGGDSLEEITKWYHDTIMMCRHGFGIGHTLHNIRPKSSPFGKSTRQTKSSLEWLNVIQEVSTSMSQGTQGRTGANMVMMPVWHPDITDFITWKICTEGQTGSTKTKYNARSLMKSIMVSDIPITNKDELINVIDKSIPLKNFNMSVVVNNKFMQAVKDDAIWVLNFSLPDHNYEVKQEVSAKVIWDLIIETAWLTADPGLMFYEAVNRDNYFREVYGPLMASNPCAEQYLHSHSVCNLITINPLKHFNFYHKRVNYASLRDTIRVAVRFSDNLITTNEYPKNVPEVEQHEKAERRIGLDFCGVADLLWLSKIKYGSKEGNKFTQDIYRFLRNEAIDYSVKLGKEKGSFPLLRRSTITVKNGDALPTKCPSCKTKLEDRGDYVLCDTCTYSLFRYIRNSYVVNQAPTGSRSRMLGVSFGIEPEYDMWYESHILDGKTVFNVNRFLEYYILKEAISKNTTKEVICEEIKQGENTLNGWLDFWVNACNLTAVDHLKVQAAVQCIYHQGISKTINLPTHASIEDISDIYVLAHELGLKGITVYRDNSHFRQVLGQEEECPSCGAIDLLKVEGCVACRHCSYSLCSI